MQLYELMSAIERMYPGASDSELARMLLLLTLRDLTPDCLNDSELLLSEFRDVQLKLHFALDQNEAVAEELDQLASSDPCEFSPSHVWTLIRAIKVQSQIVQMYLEPPVAVPLPSPCN